MTLIPVFTREIEIGPQFLDEMNHVNNTWHVHWMQEVAVAHSAVNGWDTERYLNLGMAWFVKQHSINYIQQIREGDTLLIDTWVSEMKFVTSIRQYRFRRKSDGAVVAEAQTRWGLVELKTGRPHRVPPEMLECFIELGEKCPEMLTEAGPKPNS